jgi:hypothetical protein
MAQAISGLEPLLVPMKGGMCLDNSVKSTAAKLRSYLLLCNFMLNRL